MMDRLGTLWSATHRRHSVTKKREVRMPEDWNDRTGWDAYYESRLERPSREPWDDETGSIRVEQFPHSPRT
jgi:hypothetical protein